MLKEKIKKIYRFIRGERQADFLCLTNSIIPKHFDILASIDKLKHQENMPHVMEMANEAPEELKKILCELSKEFPHAPDVRFLAAVLEQDLREME